VRLLLDPERRAALGAAARGRVAQDFCARRQVEAMVGHYAALGAAGA